MWIARDKNDSLYVYVSKPYKNYKTRTWDKTGGYDEETMSIDSDLYPEVKWEDKEPRELVLKPIKEK